MELGGNCTEILCLKRRNTGTLSRIGSTGFIFSSRDAVIGLFDQLATFGTWLYSLEPGPSCIILPWLSSKYFHQQWIHGLLSSVLRGTQTSRYTKLLTEGLAISWRTDVWNHLRPVAVVFTICLNLNMWVIFQSLFGGRWNKPFFSNVASFSPQSIDEGAACEGWSSTYVGPTRYIIWFPYYYIFQSYLLSTFVDHP